MKATSAENTSYIPQCDHSVSCIEKSTPETVLKIIKSCPAKSCALDPIPTNILKLCAGSLKEPISRIINKSISSGVVPCSLKQAVVKPLHKKPSLDKNSLKSYRPVSNLPFLSKILEKHVDNHFTSYDEKHGLGDKFQSAYTKNCSTETALLRVMNDLLTSLDGKKAMVLTLLDLSAAFDTIDHNTLLKRLKDNYGVCDTALDWMQSYLSERMQYTSIGSSSSSEIPLLYGVPQGSILGPKAFKRYSCPVSSIIKKHGLSYMIYADDTQIYTCFDPNNEQSKEHAIQKIQNCIDEIKTWMSLNYLKLNEEKTEVIIISLNASGHKLIESIDIGGHEIKPASVVKNLGVLIDDAASFSEQVNNICKTSFYTLRKVSRIRKFLTKEAAITLVHSLITSKLDYCNSLLYGLPKCRLKKLQRVMDCAARAIYGLRKRDSVTEILKDLHWLPVQQRIEYKLLLLTFKALNSLCPEYISDLITPYVPGRSLRSSTENFLVCPKYRLKTYGGRSFATAAPLLWNDLPSNLRATCDIKEFKRALKTHLFGKSYT